MSAHAVAAAAGCCCAPAPTPCLCPEYGEASSGDDFETLHVSGLISMSIEGTDCCGAEMRGNALFTGATLTRSFGGPTGGGFGWFAPRSTYCPDYPPVGEVIGDVSSTVGQCTYIAPCCNYTGCPPVLRTVIHSRLPWSYCAENVQYVSQDVCGGVVCACDEGGVPCGGNCPPASFDPYPTAPDEPYIIALTDVEVRICPIGTTQAQSWVRVACTAIPLSQYRRCEPCIVQGAPLPLTFNLHWVKECRFPGDTVRGTYYWSDYLNNGPSTQVLSIDQPCQPDLIPGGLLKLTRTLVGSPVMVIS